ncbi:MAG: hypothetical protein D6776_10610 [Planctomycetota bacterium]|nr:MAG: hypothetical protein D6776_10610 [Planctomycetota bacterium]
MDTQAQGDTTTTRGDRIFYVVLTLLFVGLSAWSLSGETGHRFTAPDGTVSWLPVGRGPAWETLGVLVAAGLTLALYSFLYKDNPFFKAAEHIYVGVGLGYSLVIAWFQYIKAELYFPLVKYWVRDGVQGQPDYLLIVPLVLGLFLLARFIRPLQWLSRWSFAFIIGFGSGVAIPNIIHANVLQQMQSSMAAIEFGNVWLAANALCALLGVVSVLVYFYFSVEHKGAIGVVSKIGIWFLMISFGASFGYTVMGRMALFVGRVQWLIEEWLRIPLSS